MTSPGAASGKEARFLTMFRRLLGRIDEGDRRLLLYMAQKMANGKARAAAVLPDLAARLIALGPRCSASTPSCLRTSHFHSHSMVLGGFELMS